MSLSTQDINLVKRKVFSYLSNRAQGNPFAHEQFRALFSWIAQHSSNPDLQFVPFSNLTDASVVADAACRMYAVYAKKQATATDAFFKLVDHASAGDGSDFVICLELDEASKYCVLIYPHGLPLANGAVITSSTTDVGTTDSTSGDGPDGFVIIGAA